MGKFILILSDDHDFTTSVVCRCLKNMGESFIRINREDPIELISLTLDGDGDIEIASPGGSITLSEVKSFWYRRGDLMIEYPKLTERQLEVKSMFDFDQAILQVREDNIRIRDYIFHFLHTRVKTLGEFHKRHNNKLIHLDIAAKIGLKTPDTIIESRKSALEKFIRNHPSGIITKVVSDTLSFTVAKGGEVLAYNIFTNKIVDFDEFPDFFAPSLFQAMIPKKADVRVFHLNKEFYAMAIISQNDPQTNIDFRRYNYTKPNRRIPFRLPNQTKNKLIEFFDKVELDTGSVDMIYGLDNQMYFLEVNPVGQFGMVSRPCNYNLEFEVAKYLAT